MHELAIAQDIFEIVRQSVPKDQEAAVRKVRLRIGKLSGVIADSLSFCFSIIVNGTSMSQATLYIDEKPTVARCRDCSCDFEIADMVFLCPACKSSNLELISGKELEIVEIELEDTNHDEAL